MEDEIDVLKSVNVSGSDDWDCFITIVHFQQCGRCSPSAKDYVQAKQLGWVWDPRGLSIRPCKKACKYIYNQCQGAKLIGGGDVIPSNITLEEMCGHLPDSDTPGDRCYDAAQWASMLAAIVSIVVMVVATLSS